MKLRPDQLTASEMMTKQIATGGTLAFSAPIGAGKTIVLAEALRNVSGRVAHVSKFRELLSQFERIADQLGVPNIEYVNLRTRNLDLTVYDYVIAADDVEFHSLTHPNVTYMRRVG